MGRGYLPQLPATRPLTQRLTRRLTELGEQPRVLSDQNEEERRTMQVTGYSPKGIVNCSYRKSANKSAVGRIWDAYLSMLTLPSTPSVLLN